MSQNVKSFELLQLNLAVFLISTSGVLGRYIELPVLITIGIRSLFAGILLYLFCVVKKISFRIDSKDRWVVFLGSMFLGLHWLSYFYALQLSSVAIGMLSLFTFPAITTVLEPLFLTTKFSRFHLVLSVLVLVGIYFLAPKIDFTNNNFIAVGFGLFSACCYACRNILMKTKIKQYNSSALMVYQLVLVSFCLLPFSFILDNSRVIEFIPEMIALALVTTAIGHTLFLYSLKNFSTITASIISCAQPIYGIIGGMIFLDEFPTRNTYIGGSIIILTVLIETIKIYLEDKSVQKI